jgi:ribosome-associated protein
MSDPQDSSSNDSTRPNKSALKRAHQALQELASELVDLPASKLDKLPLDEDFKAAVVQTKGMQKSALKRQIRYLGGMLAKRDFAPLQRALADLKGSSQAATARMHRAEHWRERLLTEGNDSLTALALEYPQVDYQQLRLLVRNCLREREQSKPPRRYRELYQFLHELDLNLDLDPEGL